MGLVAQTLEKARAYRQCIKDLRRHIAEANVRQPEENDQAHGAAGGGNHPQKH